MEIELNLGTLKTSWQSCNVKSPKGWFMLDYKGIGVGYGGYVLYDKGLLKEAAKSIGSAGQAEFDRQKKILDDIEKGITYSKCKSGIIMSDMDISGIKYTSVQLCDMWQGGVDSPLTKEEVEDKMVTCTNMMKDSKHLVELVTFLEEVENNV